VAKNIDQALEVLRELYKVGFRALVLPKELFSNIKSTTDLYKDYYGDLLRLKTVAKKFNITLSLHYPSVPEFPDETLKIFATIASVMDCEIFTIEPNFYPRMPQNQAMKLVVHKINEVVNELRIKTKIGIETTGKVNELGTIENVIEICKRTSNTVPVINWAHVHARGGYLKTQDDYKKIIDKVKEGIGHQWLNDALFFFSGVKYGLSGEIAHISFVDSDLNLFHLIRTILAYSIKGTLIFEEPEREKRIIEVLDKLGDMVR